MKFLLLLILILSFSVSSCTKGEEDNKRLRREKTKEPKKRIGKGIIQNPALTQGPETISERPVLQSPPEQMAEEQEELIFPVSYSSDHETLSLDPKDQEYTKVSISAKPKDYPLGLKAGLSGHLSLSTEGGVHTFRINPTKSNKVLHFELTEEDTILMSDDGQLVSQGDILAETTGPIIFYITHNGEITILCLAVNNQASNINVVKTFPDHPSCAE